MPQLTADPAACSGNSPPFCAVQLQRMALRPPPHHMQQLLVQLHGWAMLQGCRNQKLHQQTCFLAAVLGQQQLHLQLVLHVGQGQERTGSLHLLLLLLLLMPCQMGWLMWLPGS